MCFTPTNCTCQANDSCVIISVGVMEMRKSGNMKTKCVCTSMYGSQQVATLTLQLTLNLHRHIVVDMLCKLFGSNLYMCIYIYIDMLYMCILRRCIKYYITPASFV